MQQACQLNFVENQSLIAGRGTRISTLKLQPSTSAPEAGADGAPRRLPTRAPRVPPRVRPARPPVMAETAPDTAPSTFVTVSVTVCSMRAAPRSTDAATGPI